MTRCNARAQTAFRAQTANEIRLQNLVYAEIRESFGRAAADAGRDGWLPIQMVKPIPAAPVTACERVIPICAKASRRRAPSRLSAW
jgi:hypothetical protein